MANIKNSAYFSVSDKRTIPSNTIGTGTITTTGKDVIGTGTLFGKEVKVGDWIFVPTANEIRKIVSIYDALNAEIDNAFTVDLAGATANYTPRSIFVEISWSVTGAGGGFIDGTAVASGEQAGWGKEHREREAGNDFIDPIIVDGTGTVIKILTLK